MSAIGKSLEFETTWIHGQPVVEVVSAPDFVTCDLGFLINTGPLVQYRKGGEIRIAHQVSYVVAGWDSDWKTLTLRRVG